MFVGSSGRSRYSAQDHSRGKTELNQFVLDKFFSSFSTLSIPSDVFGQSALLSKSSVWKQTSLILPSILPILAEAKAQSPETQRPQLRFDGTMHASGKQNLCNPCNLRDRLGEFGEHQRFCRIRAKALVAIGIGPWCTLQMPCEDVPG